MTYLQKKVNKGQERSGKLSTLLKGLRRIGIKFKLHLHGDLYMTELLGRVPTIPIPIFNGIQKCFQFNSSVYSDGCSYGLDLEREGQVHQKY